MFKKVLVCLGLICLTGIGYSADQWDADRITGSMSPSDLDTESTSQYNVIERLTDTYRRGCLVYLDGTSVKVSDGELFIAEGTDSHIRAITSTLTVTTTSAVTGYNYVYANADTDATTFTVSITAGTDYRKIGWFYYDGSTILTASNIKDSSTSNIVTVLGSTDVATDATSYTDLDGMTAYFVSSGRPIRITYQGHFYITTFNTDGDCDIASKIVIDSTDKSAQRDYVTGPSYNPLNQKMEHIETVLSAGTHTIKIQYRKVSWTGSFNSISSDGATYPRKLTIEEL